MTLDPETIAMIIAILGPMIKKCLEDRQPEKEIEKILRKPNRGQRAMLLEALPKTERKELSLYWKVRRNRRIGRRLAARLVGNARKAA